LVEPSIPSFSPIIQSPLLPCPSSLAANFRLPGQIKLAMRRRFQIPMCRPSSRLSKDPHAAPGGRTQVRAISISCEDYLAGSSEYPEVPHDFWACEYR
jgi:hypothetical protein